jgi:GDPmannose 4,6-dehydratase
MKKIALIFGITGQDGAYLAKFLLKKGYIVHGVKRRASSLNTSRIDDIYEEPFLKKNFFFLHYGDLADGLAVFDVIKKTNPNEIYNLGAQSHVAVSFQIPEYTTNINANGTLRILESINKINKKIKFYQASSSEMFGGIKNQRQNESTAFHPKSPYGVSKLFAYWITKNYRESYGLFAANGILFNHESPLRGDTFVTKKIIKGLCNIKLKKQQKLFLGNLYSKRDWGHAKDYVEAMWKILQSNKADDFIISTDKTYSVKDFINIAAKKLKLKIHWRGKGFKEKGFDELGNIIIEIKKEYIRPSEVNFLRGDYTKARKKLKWNPKYSLNTLIDDMINYEMKKIEDRD